MNEVLEYHKRLFVKLKNILGAYLLNNLYITHIVLCMAALFCANQEWLYSGAGYVDPQVFINYFKNYLEHTLAMEDYYKVSRLPYILPSFLLYKVFTQPLATYFIRFLFLFFNYYFFYKISKLYFGDKISIIAVTLFIVCDSFIGSPNGTGDYHAVPAMAFFLGAFYMLSLALNNQDYKKNRFLLFYSGFLYALSLHANMLNIILTPVVLFHYYYYSKINKISLNFGKFKTDLILGVSGFLASSFLITFIHVLTGGKVTVLLQQINAVFCYSIPVLLEKNKHPWLISFEENIGNAIYLLPEIFAFVFSLFVLIIYFRKNKRGKEEAISLGLIFEFFILIITCYILHLMGQMIFYPDYMSVALLPTTYLCIASIIAFCKDKFSFPRNTVILSILCFSVFIIPFITFYNLDSILYDPLKNLIHNRMLFSIIIAFILLIYFIISAKLNKISTVLFLISLSFINLLSSVDHSRYYSFSVFNKDTYARDLQHSIYKVHDLAESVPGNKELSYSFFDQKKIGGRFGSKCEYTFPDTTMRFRDYAVSIASAMFPYYSQTDISVASYDKECRRFTLNTDTFMNYPPKLGDKINVFVQNEEALANFDQEMQRLGYKIHLINQLKIDMNKVQYLVVWYDIIDIKNPPPKFSKN